MIDIWLLRTCSVQFQREKIIKKRTYKKYTCMCYKILIPRHGLHSKLWSNHASLYFVSDNTTLWHYIKMEWQKPLHKTILHLTVKARFNFNEFINIFFTAVSKEQEPLTFWHKCQVSVTCCVMLITLDASYWQWPLLHRPCLNFGLLQITLAISFQCQKDTSFNPTIYNRGDLSNSHFTEGVNNQHDICFSLDKFPFNISVASVTRICHFIHM